MTDLLDALPAFPVEEHSRLIAALETNLVTTSDLLTLDVLELARRVQLPILDLKHLVTVVKNHLHQSYRLAKHPFSPENGGNDEADNNKLALIRNGLEVAAARPLISSLDDSLDDALGGGIAAGYVTEVTGESGAGKTQFLLTLLLAVQLPAPQGFDKGAIYVSTEHVLPTQRLQTIMTSHPKLKDREFPPSLKRILSIQTPDLEAQDHILAYQLPVAIKSQNIGLVVIDSIAANYRAEIEASKNGDMDKSRAKTLAVRSVDLIKTGALLRKIALENGCAIVVANQVSDRFEQQMGHRWSLDTQRLPLGQESMPELTTSEEKQSKRGLSSQIAEPSQPQSSPAPISYPSSSTSSMPKRPLMTYDRAPSPTLLDPRITLDHQMRFFTGWGDNDSFDQKNLKTPALGLTWTNQIACRIAIIRESTFAPATHDPPKEMVNNNGVPLPMAETGLGGADWSKRRWRRYLRVAFAAWTQETEEGDRGVEFEIWSGGIRSIKKL